MTRKDMKDEVKSKLNPNFGFFFILFLPYFVLSFANGWVTNSYSSEIVSAENELFNKNYYGFVQLYFHPLTNLISIISYLLMVGIMFVLIDVMRNKDDMQHGFAKSTTVLKNNYLLPAVIVGFFNWLFTFLWTLLFIIPGVIKSFSYSQAQFIYRDALDRGEQMSYLDAITKSRKLMDGHKWEFLVLKLSFIWWGLLMVVSFGIAGFYVIPYYRLTMADYYDHLVMNEKEDAQSEAESA